jgi:hypothetical protein
MSPDDLEDWCPADAPRGGARIIGQLMDFEITACLNQAERRLAGDLEQLDRRRYREWLRRLLAEKADRVTKRANHVRTCKRYR